MTELSGPTYTIYVLGVNQSVNSSADSSLNQTFSDPGAREVEVCAGLQSKRSFTQH